MKLVVFGATGSVGRHVVEQALAAGHEVTAVSRNPRDLPGAVRALKADVLDPAAVVEAVRGQEAVIVVLGAGARGNLRAPGTANIIRAMQETGVKRLVCQSTLGAGDSRADLNFVWKYMIFGLLLRRVLTDHEGQEAHVRTSGLDWTIVRPAAFTDGPKTGLYRHGFQPGDRSISAKVSRADVAHFLLSVLDNSGTYGQTPGLSY